MKPCLHCAADLAEDAQFCSSCGRPASSALVVPTLSFNKVSPAAHNVVASIDSMAGLSALNLSPGSVLLGRYRILNLLGRGGMGLVYRADDLKLGQTVALKFLPTSLARNKEDLERFLAEVRTARQVSHPNVCRVYDVAESQGHYFLSMEYVDGENLATLLGRIGRLPPAKALEISHELCAGLAAAHARQVVHRDLKPANIMIDGRGHARITDFGLAVAPDAVKTGELAGTPAYMAPELFEGRPATVQSDLYALGIVLYELYTGKHPWDRRPASDSRRRQLPNPPSSPSHHAPEIDAAVDRIILRCLEKDPGGRPSSVLQVAAALPGGNPLALAIAAGETPSPEMVAAAGETGAVAPAKAWILVAGVAAALLVVAFLAQRGMLVNLVPSKDPALLVERSQQIASSLGYNRANDKAYWFNIDAAYFPYSARIASPARYRTLATAFPSPLQFWYRQSPQALETTHDPFRVNQEDPALYYSGEAEVGLDSAGRLNYFAAIAPQKETLPNGDVQPQWQDLFREAGLDWSQSRAAPATWMPDVPADRTFGWETVSSGQSTRIAGATYHGRIVFFRVLAPWAQPGRISPMFAPLAGRIGFAMFVVVAIGVFVLSLVFARKNLKLGRGDWRGALRASGFFLIVVFIGFLLTPHYSSSAVWIWTWFQVEFGIAAGTALTFGVFYLALEPYVRRTWPEMLISWSRLLVGGWRDPLVGRDLLIGTLFGIAASIAPLARVALPYWFPIANISAGAGVESQLGTVPAFIGGICLQSEALMNAMGTLACLFVIARITRRKWAGIILVSIFLGAINLVGENLVIEIPLAALIVTVMLYCLLRFGLLASAVAWIVSQVFAPLTTDLSRWYAWRGLVAVSFLFLLALYGFKVALGGQSAFGALLEE